MQSKALDQLKQLWAKMNPRQRLIIGGGTLLTLLAVGLLVRTMATPDFKPLMTGLEPADAQAISQQLAAKKIEYRPSTDGKGIDVPADQLDAARMEVARLPLRVGSRLRADRRMSRASSSIERP